MASKRAVLATLLLISLLTVDLGVDAVDTIRVRRVSMQRQPKKSTTESSSESSRLRTESSKQSTESSKMSTESSKQSTESSKQSTESSKMSSESSRSAESRSRSQSSARSFESSSRSSSESSERSERSSESSRSRSESSESSLESSRSASSESSAKSSSNPATQAIMQRQLEQVSRCFPILYNLTMPKVYDRTFFPKYKSHNPRFRFHCQHTSTSDSKFPLDPTFLSSYNIDGMYLPEWVAYKISRPVFGVSRVPNTTRNDCMIKGGGKFFLVRENGITTPDATFTMYHSLQLLNAGKDKRDGIQKGQVVLPTDFLTCPEKEGTYAMTNVIPMNKYLYTMNWAEADKALRKYVARNVDVPRPGYEIEDLGASTKYRPIYVVAGPHFSSPDYDKFDWVYEQEDINEAKSIKRGVIPPFVWQAVLDPAIIKTHPSMAAIAWYCNNRAKGPWPSETVGEDAYENGPKLCKVMSLDQLESITGIRPFPDAPKNVRTANPNPAAWHLTDKF